MNKENRTERLIGTENNLMVVIEEKVGRWVKKVKVINRYKLPGMK